MEKKVTEISLPLLGTISKTKKDVGKNQRKNQTWWNFIAFLCLAGGASFGVIGLFLSGIGYFSGADGVDSKIGTILACAAFPLMIFGAHALDKLEESEKKISRRIK